MANTVSILSYANTFGDSMRTTNSLVNENNDLAVGNYNKKLGTLIVADPTNALQANGPVIFYNTLQSTGTGSSVSIQNNLTVTQGQVYFSNTSLGLTNAGKSIFGALISANGSGTGLAVANNATIGNNLSVNNTLYVNNATTLNNTLSVALSTTLSNTLSVAKATNLLSTLDVAASANFATNINVVNNTNSYNFNAQADTSTNTLFVRTNSNVVANSLTNILQANTSVNTATLSVTGNSLTNVLQANTSMNTRTLSVTGTSFTNILQANTSVNTSTISVSGTSFTDTVQANTSMNTRTLSVTGTSFTKVLQANTSVNTAILSVTGTGFLDVVQANSYINTAAMSISGPAFVNLLQSNTSVNTGTLSVAGNSYTNILQANTSVNTVTISVTGTSFTNYVQSNSGINTATLSVTGNTYTNILQANTSVNTTTLSVTGKGSLDYVQANTNLNTPLVTSTDIRNTGNTITNILQANTYMNTRTLSVTGTSFTNILQSNTSVNTATLSVTGTGSLDVVQANTSINTATLAVTQRLNANTAAGFFDRIQTVKDISVGGNFVINGSTVYNSPDFTLSAASPNQTSTINVYRNTSNATIRWNESATPAQWQIKDTVANTYSRILTEQQITDNALSISTTTAASANVANTLNTYVNTNVKSLQDQISTNVSSLQTQISTNVAYLTGVTNTTNTNYGLAWTRANSSSQSFTGTTGSAAPTTPAGVITFTSTNGATITGSGSTLTINDGQDIRTSATPQFTGLTLSNALAIAQGGTGGTSSSAALTNLLPAYDSSKYGYVLGTYGVGNYQWVAGGTGGGGGSTVPGTTINSSKLTYTANGTGTGFISPVYISGADQLRVYVNGIRQIAGYTETSGNTSGVGIVTFSSAPTNGQTILLEVDGYILNPYYANNIVFTAPQGGIISSANTIQLAIQDLESRKATLASPTFTGTPAAPTATTTDSSTTIATTAFVKNALGSGTTYAHSISGNAGTATTLQTPRAINGVNFDGSAAITVTSDASTLSGTTLKSTVVASSLTSVGTITSGTWNGTTIAVLNGGTGTTTSTGTGSVVLSTSPTLVTPALGTPASGTLTNCTFPTLNQNTTGTAAQATTVYDDGAAGGTVGYKQASGLKVAYSTTSGTATNATQLGGYSPQTAPSSTSAVGINQFPRSDGNGYMYLGFINSNTSNAENPTVSQVIVTNGTDGFYRKSSISSFTSAVQTNATGTWGISISGTAATASALTNWTSLSDRPSLDYNAAGRTNGVYSCAGAGTNGPGTSYLNLLHMANATDVAFQIAGGYTSDNMYFRGSFGLNTGTGWSAWRTVIHSGNIGSQSVSAATNATNGRYVYNDGTYGGTVGYVEPSSSRVAYASTAGSSTTCTTAARATRANGNLYIDDNYGNSIVGVYSASKFQGIFAMGDSYKLPADGSAATGFYGLSWSHPNAGGIAANLDSHGALVVINGAFACALSNSIVAAGNITAYSDERLKTNWKDLGNDFVSKLATVKTGTFDRIDRELGTQVGVSAQSLREVLPEAVNEADDEDKTLSVHYGNAALASAVMLARELVSLKDLVKELRAEIDELKKS